MELSKLNEYRVMDRYDVEYITSKNEFIIENCYGKLCMVEAGKILNTDKMLTGSLELLSETIVITLRVIDVKSETIEMTQVMEFLNIKTKIPTMINITMNTMFGNTLDENVVNKLTKPFDYESSVNFPDDATLNLNGPRMGFTAFTGNLAKTYSSPLRDGGFDALPFMFQFGYQFEIKYLNQGDFQALFEIIPIITGLDQGKFIPSVSLLNGLRSNRTGWELAFGPVIYVLKEAKGYYDSSDDNKWKLSNEYKGEDENPDPVIKRLDSRGNYDFTSAFVFGVGKTFKSGRLNIPLNAFFIPGKGGHRFGLSLGFNASRYKK